VLPTTDRRQTTDGRATAYSEREREFTFAKNSNGLWILSIYIKLTLVMNT